MDNEKMQKAINELKRHPEVARRMILLLEAILEEDSQSTEFGLNEGIQSMSGGALRVLVANYLHKLYVPVNILGYQYIKEGICLILEEPTILNKITKDFYPELAKTFKTTPTRVERAIRHAIGSSWKRGSETMKLYFEDLQGKSQPTNSEFLATVAENIRLEHFD